MDLTITFKDTKVIFLAYKKYKIPDRIISFGAARECII